MNKRIAIFLALLFLYLFCTFDSISLAEKGLILSSMEHEKVYENPHKPHEKQNKPSNKLKNLKNFIKIRKKNKILEDENNKIIDISKANKTNIKPVLKIILENKISITS